MPDFSFEVQDQVSGKLTMGVLGPPILSLIS